VFDAVFERARCRFAGLIEAASVRRHQPAVIETAQSVGFDAAVREIDAAMRTELRHQRGRAVRLPVEREFLAEHLHRNRPV